MKKFAILFLSLFLFAGTATAAPLVYTGPGANVGGGTSLFGYSDDDYQSVAGWFTLSSSAVITDIAIWMNDYHSGDFEIGIYADGYVPNTSVSAIHSTLASVNSPGTMNTSSWQGKSGLSWSLSSGSYWAVFSIPYDSSLDSAVPNYSNGSANPLDAYAWGGYGSWNRSSASTWGLCINGDCLEESGGEEEIPEPATALLLGAGLLGLASRRKRA